MKKINKYLIVATLLLAAAGMTACGEKENVTPSDTTEQPTPTPDNPPADDTLRYIENVGTHYALHQMEGGNLVLIPAGDTVVYNATAYDIDTLDMVELQFKIENTQRDPLLTYQELKMVEGMASMAPSLFPNASHGATVCGNGSCPWDGRPYTVESGMYDKPLGIQIRPSHQAAGDWALYRLVVGVGENLENATIIYLRVNL